MALPSNILAEPVSNEEASRWIEDKPLVSRQVFDELLPELKARAFLVTGLEDAAVAREIRDAIAKLPQGEDYEKLKGGLLEKLGPWFDADEARRRAELLLRLHGFQAYRTASRAVHDRQSAVFSFRQYLSMDDSRVRPSHRAMHGMILPADSPFWRDHPGGWGCRCDEVALLPDEVDEIRDAENTLPLEERSIMDGSRLAKLEREGRLIRLVKDENGRPLKSALHEWNVKNVEQVGAPQSLRIDPEQLKSRYDDETWSEFEAGAKRNKLTDGRTVWEWLNGKTGSSKPGQKAASRGGLKPAKAPAQAPVITSKISTTAGTPLTGKLFPQALTKEAQKKLDEVMSLIDSVHGDGPLTNIPVNTKVSRGSDGTFWSSRMSGEAKGISFRVKARKGSESNLVPEFSLIHEIGHWLDKSGHKLTGWKTEQSAHEMKPWMDAVKASQAWQLLDGWQTSNLSFKSYATSPKELWARCYAQFIAEETGSPKLLAQAEIMRTKWGANGGLQWTPEDFQPIRSAMRDLFVKWGWMTQPQPPAAP